MRKKISNAKMRWAAERRLADHLATRPATVAEAAEIAAAARADADSLDAAIQAARDAAGAPTPAFRHKRAGEIRANANRASARTRNEIVSALTPEALHARLTAEAWERVAEAPRAVWDATRAELAARVDFYRALEQGDSC